MKLYKKLMYVVQGEMFSYAMTDELTLQYKKDKTTVAINGPLSAYKYNFPYEKPILLDLKYYKRHESNIVLWEGEGTRVRIPYTYIIMVGDKEDWINASDFQVALLEFIPRRKLG